MILLLFFLRQFAPAAACSIFLRLCCSYMVRDQVVGAVLHNVSRNLLIAVNDSDDDMNRAAIGADGSERCFFLISSL